MKSRLTKTDARRYRKRWEVVNAAERRELRATPVKLKFLQLAALMVSAKKMGWVGSLAAEEAEVRNRWNRLRKILSA
ncbi:MAG: hypothetical protein HY695_23350 [Deltaproteobacteria bacterium]|nr:hypothetical protein [Deltaproteobacteria bacterium]